MLDNSINAVEMLQFLFIVTSIIIQIFLKKRLTLGQNSYLDGSGFIQTQNCRIILASRLTPPYNLRVNSERPSGKDEVVHTHDRQLARCIQICNIMAKVNIKLRFLRKILNLLS